MQYGNPYFAQPFQQIQPYQDRLAQLQNSYSHIKKELVPQRTVVIPSPRD